MAKGSITAADIHALVRAAENVLAGQSDVMAADYMQDIIDLANQHDALVLVLKRILDAEYGHGADWPTEAEIRAALQPTGDA